MSLIEQALRRGQQPLLASAQTKTTQPASPTTPEEPTAHPWPTTPPASPPFPVLRTTRAPVVLAGVILALTVALLAVGISWMNATVGGRQPAATQRPVELEAPAPEPVSERLPAAPRRARGGSPGEDGLQLTGIVEGSGEPLAMINGMVLGIGDRVEGATLLEIANGSVRLRRADGNETVLQVSP